MSGDLRAQGEESGQGEKRRTRKLVWGETVEKSNTAIHMCAGLNWP